MKPEITILVMHQLIIGSLARKLTHILAFLSVPH